MSESKPSAALDRSVLDFASELDNLRRRAGLTLRELSMRTGAPRSTLSDFLRGRHLPRWEKVQEILEALGVDPDRRREFQHRWEQANYLAARSREDQRFRADQLPAELQSNIKYMNAIKSLTEAIKDEESVVIRLNSLIIIKHSGRIIARVLNENQLRSIDGLLNSPDELLSRIAEMDNGVSDS